MSLTILGCDASESHAGELTDSIAPKMKMTTPVPKGITTADSVETRLGTLRFTDGFPDDSTIKKVLDNLDFQRGVQAVLASIPAASLHAMREGIRTFGPDNTSAIIFEQLMDSRALFLTANTSSVYCMMWLDVKNGPMVIETPPDVLGIIDDAWFHYVADFGRGVRTRARAVSSSFCLPATMARFLLATMFPVLELSETGSSGVGSK